jgi:hypothetical protein
LAQLDTGNGAAEDGDMDAELTLMRQEMSAGFKEVNTRIDEVRREVTARIDELRKETAENFKLTEVKMDEARQQTRDNYRFLDMKLDEFRKEASRHSEVQFRWMMGLLVTLLLGIGGLYARLV